MKKWTIGILIFLSIIALLLRYGGQVYDLMRVKQNSGVRILSLPDQAQVLINGKEVGKTPYQDDTLTAGDIDVKLQQGDNKWEGNVPLIEGTLTVVNRELGQDVASSSGEILTLQKGQGVTIVSYPSEADIEVDSKAYGKTPITLNISPGEHDFTLSKTGYLKRSIQASVPQDYNLTLNVDLALSEADLTSIVAPPITETPKVVVNSTPTGFLRVRDKPSVNGKEVGRVVPGDELILLEEQDSWDHIRLQNGIEGYVSSAYVTKQATQ